MGFECCGSAAKTTVARPLAMSFGSNPISRAMETSFVFARSLKPLAREFLEYSSLGGSGLRFPRTNSSFEPGVIVAEKDFVIVHGRFSGIGQPVNMTRP